MKKWLLPGLMLVASIQAFADQTLVQELVTKSGVPLKGVQEMLAKCESDDQTDEGMYLCAWRDLIVAERELQKIVDQRNRDHPKHQAAVDARMARWKKADIVDCQKFAHRDWAGGSLEPVMAMVCHAVDTQDMVKAMGGNPAALPCKKGGLPCLHGKPVYYHNPIILRGLTARLREESAPFRTQPRQ